MAIKIVKKKEQTVPKGLDLFDFLKDSPVETEQQMSYLISVASENSVVWVSLATILHPSLHPNGSEMDPQISHEIHYKAMSLGQAICRAAVRRGATELELKPQKVQVRFLETEEMLETVIDDTLEGRE